MATQVEELIIAIKAVGTDKAEAELLKLKRAGASAGKSVENAGTKAEAAAKRFSKMRGPTSALTTTTGQLSVQFQDIAVQAQQGTDALRIFAQQGPQIASVFGPQGAVFGAVIAFGALLAGPLISSLFGASGAAEKLREEIDELFKSTEKMSPAIRQFKLLTLKQQAVESADALRDANKALEEQQNSVTGTAEKITELTAARDLEQAKLNVITEQIGLLTGAKNKEQEAIDETIKKLETQLLMFGATDEAILKHKLITMGAIETEVNRAIELQNAITKLEEKKKAEEDAAKAKAKADADADKEEAARRRAQLRLRSQVAKIQKEIRDQEEKEEKERNERIFEEQKRHMERVFKEFEENEKKKKEMQANVNNALLSIEDKLLKGKSEKQKAAYRIGVNLMNDEKRANAAKIISDSYGAAMSAYKSLAGIPFIGPALGAAAAGVIIAAGASYAAQSLQGRALGGQVRAGESYVVGERGPEVLTMGSSGRITPNEKIGGTQSQAVNKTANVTFNITANDTSGFDELIRSRRGQIIGIINEALNDQGKAALA